MIKHKGIRRIRKAFEKRGIAYAEGKDCLFMKLKLSDGPSLALSFSGRRDGSVRAEVEHWNLESPGQLGRAERACVFFNHCNPFRTLRFTISDGALRLVSDSRSAKGAPEKWAMRVIDQMRVVLGRSEAFDLNGGMFEQFITPDIDDDSAESPAEAEQDEAVAEPEAQDIRESEALKELMGLVGCTAAKKLIVHIVQEYMRQKELTRRGYDTPVVYHHIALMGNPGCAKTTIARLIGRILADYGVAEGFIEVSRADLIQKYQGWTAGAVKEIFENNRNRVIFIDEAYSLASVNHNDSYSDEAIAQIVKAMEDYPDIIVILAGYSREMRELLESNSGLSSRIQYRLEMPDYSVDELVQIAHVIAKRDHQCVITDEADGVLRRIFDREIEKRDATFGNGRFARQIVGDALDNLNDRLSLMSVRDVAALPDEALTTLDEGCFSAIRADAKRAARADAPRIGFSTAGRAGGESA